MSTASSFSPGSPWAAGAATAGGREWASRNDIRSSTVARDRAGDLPKAHSPERCRDGCLRPVRGLVRFDDPDAYLATFVSGDTRLTLPGRAPFASRVIRAGSDDAWFRTNLSGVANTLRGPPVRWAPPRFHGGPDLAAPREGTTVIDPGGSEIGSFSFPFVAFEAAVRHLHD